MLKMLNQSDNCIVVCHEIYGVNRHIKEIATFFSNLDYDVLCPNFLGTDPFDYANAGIAYEHFTKKIGFLKAYIQLRDVLKSIRGDYKRVFIVGFSVGATLAWMCSEEMLCDGIIGFYGSRIRDYLNITPKCPVLLFFPTNEPSFDVHKIIKILDQKSDVNTMQLKGEHGFCDPFSKNYFPLSQQRAFQVMKDFLQKLVDKD